MAKIKTLPVEVFRWHLGDCTNGGISGKHNTLYLISPEGWCEVEDTDERIIKVVEGFRGRLHVEPVNDPNKREISYMSGGNFVYSSDGRFPFDYPLSVHDRSETLEDYEALSR